MNIIETYGDCDDNYQKLFAAMFKVLHCHSLWIMHVVHGKLNILASDKIILEHYWANKYYLDDPVFNNKAREALWTISLGTDSEEFHKNGFLYELDKLFHVEEFVSIDKKIDFGFYCFRFFTSNNRFIFMNKILNNMPIIKCFLNKVISQYDSNLCNHPSINLTTIGV